MLQSTTDPSANIRQPSLSIRARVPNANAHAERNDDLSDDKEQKAAAIPHIQSVGNMSGRGRFLRSERGENAR